jgi:hypothetical protein
VLAGNEYAQKWCRAFLSKMQALRYTILSRYGTSRVGGSSAAMLGYQAKTTETENRKSIKTYTLLRNTVFWRVCHKSVCAVFIAEQYLPDSISGH